MDKVANVSPKRRGVRCPECWEVLSEPASPIYKCPFCSTYLRAKGIPPDFRGDLWQMPMNENNQGTQNSQQTNELEAKSINDGSEPIRLQKQDQLNGHEINGHTSVDGNVRQQEQLLSEIVSVVENRREQGRDFENHVGNGSTSVDDNDMLADCASKIGTAVCGGVDCGEEEGAPASNGGESQEAQLLLDHTNSQLQLQDAENCSMLRATEEKKELAGEDECEPAGEGNEQISQSEIIRENDDELSFKYISSALESYDPPAPRKRTPRLSKLSSGVSVSLSEMSMKPLNADLSETHPFSSAENSDDYESYSSHDSVDSEFDFRSPSTECMQLPNLSDLLFQQKMLLPDVGHEEEEITLLNSNGVVTSSIEIDANTVSDVLNAMEEGGRVCCDSAVTPHQLEWQDVDHENEEFASPNLNGAVTSSIEIHANTASDVLNGVEQGGEVERAELQWHPQREDPIKKETFSVGDEDAVATVRDSLHVQGGNAESIGGLANVIGSVDSKEGDTSELKEDYNGNQGDLAYQLNNKDLQERVSGLLDLLSSGAGHPSKLKCVATLKEGITNALISGRTEAPSYFLSDGSKLENCLATQENINNVANAKLEDSIATIASKDANSTGREHQSKITPLMICIEKIQEGLPGPSCSQQNTLLPDANKQSRRASTNSDTSAKRDVDNVHLSQNKEPDSVRVQSFPIINEQGNLSSHSAFNNSESRLRHRRIYSSEATQGHAWEDTVNIFDSRMHHKRNYSGETAAQSEYTAQVQKNIHYEGTRMPRSARILEGSSKLHQKHAQAAYELAEGQGPWPHQANMHMMQHSMNYYSGATNCFSPGSSQPFGSYCYSNGSDSFARGVPCASLAFSYRAPSYPWMPPVMPGMHCGCHPVAPVCRACTCYQHSHVPQLSNPPCGHCFNQPLPLARQQGHAGLCNYHQAHQIQASDQGGSVVHHSPAYFSPQTGHLHDTAMARGKPHVSLTRKPKHYPPFTQGSTAPYIICKGCDKILEVPTDIPLTNAPALKVRCRDCRKVAKFSVLTDNQGTCNVALGSTMTNGVSKSSSHSIQYTEHSRQSPVSNVVQSMDASRHQGINSGSHPHKQGSFDSQQQISAVSKRRGSLSLDEIVQSTQCEADTPDQDEFFFRSLSRHSEFDSSRIFFNMFKASSSAVGASNFDGLVKGDDIPLQAPVDEKEEGLDFGAPRVSDGESPDLKLPESRMRWPENKQHFKFLDQERPIKDSHEDGEGGQTTENAEKQAFDLKRKMIAEGKKPSTSLFVLLNQNSSKFEINMEERVSFDESRSVLCSTASSSPVHDNHTNERSTAGDSSNSKTCKLSSNRFLRKGPNYVAGVFRRSMKDFSRGSR